MEQFGNIKVRYWVGIPYLYFIGTMGGNIIYDALVIGILAGFTDIIRERGDGAPPAAR